jgi:hypothetical protein
MTASDAIELRLEIAALAPAPAVAPDDHWMQTVDTAGDEALAAIALNYRTTSARLLDRCRVSSSLTSINLRPAPFDVIDRFHSGIYFKTTRALVGRALAANGLADRRADADACAAQVFAYAARSADALSRIPDGDERRALTTLLDVLLLGLDRRFPEARARSRRAIDAARSGIKGHQDRDEREI